MFSDSSHSESDYRYAVELVEEGEFSRVNYVAKRSDDNSSIDKEVLQNSISVQLNEYV